MDIPKLHEYINEQTGSFEIKYDILNRHGDYITCVKFSPDGNFLVTASRNKKIILWNTHTSEYISTFTAHTSSVKCIDISQDSKYIISSAFDEIIIWDLNCNIIFQDEIDKRIYCSIFSNNCDFYVSVGSQILKFTNKTYEDVLPEKSKSRIGKLLYNKKEDDIYYCNDGGFIMTCNVPNKCAKVHDMGCNSIRFDSTYNMLITSSNDKTSKLINSIDLSVLAVYKCSLPIRDALIVDCKDHVLLCSSVEDTQVSNTMGECSNISIYSKILEDRLSVFNKHGGSINTMDMTADNKYLCTGSLDGNIIIYQFPEKYY